MVRWGDALLAEADRIGELETRQNGKLFAETRSQVAAAANWLYYFGGLAVLVPTQN